MNTAQTIVNQIGRADIARLVGVGLPAVSNAIRRGKLPTAWFPAIKAECEARGLECPESAFNWKTSEAAE